MRSTYLCIVCDEHKAHGKHYQKHPRRKDVSGFVCRTCDKRHQQYERDTKLMATEEGMVAVKVALRANPELLALLGAALHKDCNGKGRELAMRLGQLRKGLAAVIAEESMLSKLDTVTEKIKTILAQPQQ